MASKSAIITNVIIIDTSYLPELFKVPGFSQKPAIEEIRERYAMAIKSDSRLYVPLPCIFELADHIAEIDDGNHRNKLGNEVYKTIKTSVEEGIPWLITPPIEAIDFLPKLFEECVNKYMIEGIGLTDTCTIHEAGRLKKKYSSFNYKVHIWTKDRDLKAQEPDSEQNPILG